MVAYSGNNWSVCECIVTIVSEANKIAPGRSQASDGTIGDQAHQSRKSDHNPDIYRKVCAVDITHDPAHGFDAWKVANNLADKIIRGTEKRIEYIVAFNGKVTQIFSYKFFGGWKWRSYSGDSHASHIHISFVHTRSINSQIQPFGIGAATPPPVIKPVTPKGQPVYFAKKSNSAAIFLITANGKVGMNTPAELAENQKALAAAGFNTNVVVFPITSTSDAGNFIDRLPAL